MVRLPAGVRGMAARDDSWAEWVHRLPGTAEALLEEWALTQDGLAQHGFCALVLPVRTRDGDAAMLKISYPHEEAELEHLALQHWHGNGAVRLLRADPRRFALLLERLHDEKLTEVWDVEACEVVAGLYGRLHVSAPPQLTRLSTWSARWERELAALPRGTAVPHRFVEQARAIARDFASDPDTDGRLVHGDLHYMNVLSSDREPWLAIDPKPLSGDPHFEPAPMLWNRWDEVVASGRVRDTVRQRFHTLVDVAGLAEDRARDWVVLREVLNAVGAVEDDEPEEVTTAITIAKAVQD
jgi:streptomycin 6-kinase